MGLAPTHNKRLHKEKNKWNKCKNNFHIKMMRHVGMEVPKSIETRKHLGSKAGDDGMQQ